MHGQQNVKTLHSDPTRHYLHVEISLLSDRQKNQKMHTSRNDIECKVLGAITMNLRQYHILTCHDVIPTAFLV